MSKPPPTFSDSQTGEEIASTRLARWGARLSITLLAVFYGGLIGTGLGALLCGPFGRLKTGLLFGLIIGMFFGLLSGLTAVAGRSHRWAEGAHNAIARWQHLRRSRPEGEEEPE